VSSLLSLIGKIVVPSLIILAVLLFFWKIVVSLYQVGENHEAVGEKKMILVWGVVALFVMVSIWGIIRVFTNTAGVTPVIPQLQNLHN
jgi:TRAP-type mannitol/chloroaromatic compound transport system permease small subunit